MIEAFNKGFFPLMWCRFEDNWFKKKPIAKAEQNILRGTHPVPNSVLCQIVYQAFFTYNNNHNPHGNP